jgi:hypothetical protein
MILPDGWHERLEQLRFLELAQEPERGSPDELVGVLQVLPVGVAHQDHLLQQLSVPGRFGADLPEDQKKFLYRVILKNIL